MDHHPQLSIKPPRPRRGSKAAIVSPSAPGVALFPHRIERGANYLRGLGLEPVLMPNAAAIDQWVAGSPQARADDIHSAFADVDVSIVLCAIGGNHAHQVVLTVFRFSWPEIRSDADHKYIQLNPFVKRMARYFHKTE